MWTFKPRVIFEVYDRFVARLMKIKDIFVTANEFMKLEKVEIAGLKGRSISRHLAEVIYNTIIIYSSI